MGFMDMVRTALVRTSERDAEPSGTSFHPISEPRQLSAVRRALERAETA